MQEPPNWRKSMGLQLNLGTNEIGEAGATQLAKALSTGRCPAGLQLNLGTNALSAYGLALAVTKLPRQEPPNWRTR
jgi:hypothetical protein